MASAQPTNASTAKGILNFLLTPKNKKLEKEKKNRKDILKRQKILYRNLVIQDWKIVFGDVRPKKMKDISVIKNVSARNVWMEDMYIFNQIKQLKPDEIFHAPDVYALRWQPPGSLFKVLIPMNDPKVQENVISVLSKLPKMLRKNMIFYFAPITPHLPMFSERVHPSSLVSYRTKNSVLKKLSEFFIAGKIDVVEIQQVFTEGLELWNSTLFNLLPEDEQVYHHYLNDKKVAEVNHKAIAKSYTDGDISLSEYDDLKFPDRKIKNDILAMQYPLPFQGEDCIICDMPHIGVIKCQNCVNMVCVSCIKIHFTADDAETALSNAHDPNAEKGSFLLLHHKYCMKLGKLPDIYPPVIQEPAWLRTFRDTSREAVLRRLAPPVKPEYEAEVEVEDVEDETERKYRLQQEGYARDREIARLRKLAIDNPPALKELMQQLREKKKRYNKFQKEIEELNAKIADTSHTEQFIARNVRLRDEQVDKLNATVAKQLIALREEGDGLSLMGEYIEEYHAEINRLLRLIQMLSIKKRDGGGASSKKGGAVVG
jgi:hypothetical protein